MSVDTLDNTTLIAESARTMTTVSEPTSRKTRSHVACPAQKSGTAVVTAVHTVIAAQSASKHTSTSLAITTIPAVRVGAGWANAFGAVARTIVSSIGIQACPGPSTIYHVHELYT